MIEKTGLRKFLFILYLFVLTTLLFILYLHLSVNDRFSPFLSPFDQTAQRPFVYRVLPSLIIDFLSFLTGTPSTICAILLMYFSLLGFFAVYSLLVKLFIPKINLFFSLVFPAIGLIPFLIQSRHVYDFPLLLLYTFAYYLLEKREFGKYTVIFLLASLTKETALFLVLFFALHFRGLTKKQYFATLVRQALIFGLVRGILMIAFLDNPGSMVQYHFIDHIHSFFVHPFAAIGFYALIILIFVLGLTYRGTHASFIKDAFLAIGIPIAALYMFFGVPFEIRVFLELFPVIALLLSLKLVSFFGNTRSKPKEMLENSSLGTSTMHKTQPRR